MRIVIAPDKFKGSLSAPEVARAVAAGLLAARPDTIVVQVPVADGGEGTLDAAVGAGFTLTTASVTGPTGERLDADYAVQGTRAVIEMATASGLAVLPGGGLQARTATSRGTGDLIRDAMDRGCTDIVLGVGGSASTDGGAGLLAALGAKLLDAEGGELSDGGAALIRLARVDLSALDPRLASVSFTLASDVDNPLRGANGAAAIFGPQKGATPTDVTELDDALGQFVTCLAAELGESAQPAALLPGAGAAGGVGYAALTVLKARRRAGIDVVLDLTRLAGKLQGADLVITGEGSLDEQSLGGKTPLGVAQAAAAAGVPVMAVCGRTPLTPQQLHRAGFIRTIALTDLEPNVDKCMANAAELLTEAGRMIAADVDESSNGTAVTGKQEHKA
ncbi:glycerate kinase [Arthrobacter roseus]|uniref:glycerate kinase n=1 Tax=Arthrobacter roseus TaxID=136274 RepID=UPI001964EFB9|nr:glycerate kinase [Arthrobacter roseus]MBM7846970.1 glycerate kinase [Arthrobacter roseus]